MARGDDSLQELAAEAEDLISSIRALRQSAGSYEDATGHVKSVAARVDELATETERLTKLGLEILKEIRSLGSTAVANTLRDIAGRVQETSESAIATEQLINRTLTDQCTAVREVLNDVKASTTESSSQYSDLLKKTADESQKRAASTSAAVQKALKAVQTDTAKAVEETLDHVEGRVSETADRMAAAQRLVDETLANQSAAVQGALDDVRGSTSETRSYYHHLLKETAEESQKFAAAANDAVQKALERVRTDAAKAVGETLDHVEGHVDESTERMAATQQLMNQTLAEQSTAIREVLDDVRGSTTELRDSTRAMNHMLEETAGAAEKRAVAIDSLAREVQLVFQQLSEAAARSRQTQIIICAATTVIVAIQLLSAFVW